MEPEKDRSLLRRFGRDVFEEAKIRSFSRLDIGRRDRIFGKGVSDRLPPSLPSTADGMARRRIRHRK
jgi:hypothetical protein